MYVWVVYWITFLISVVTNVNGKGGKNVYESVNGKPGPDDWPNQYPGCNGHAQSPIDIYTTEAVYSPYLEKFAFSKPTLRSKFLVKNNGHSIQIDTEGNFFVYRGGLQNVYSTAQIHFHWGDNNRYGSEHTVNGISYPLEMHIVNWNSDKYESFKEALQHPDGLAVLGVLFELSAQDNPVLNPIIQAIQKVRDPDLDNSVELPAVPIKKLLPRSARRFYRYQGSLTTPGCEESVIWTVFEKSLTISERQLNVFRNCLFPRKPNRGSTAGRVNNGQMREPLVNNFRPVQPLKGRQVYKSYDVFLPGTQLLSKLLT